MSLKCQEIYFVANADKSEAIHALTEAFHLFWRCFAAVPVSCNSMFHFKALWGALQKSQHLATRPRSSERNRRFTKKRIRHYNQVTARPGTRGCWWGLWITRSVFSQDNLNKVWRMKRCFVTSITGESPTAASLRNTQLTLLFTPI